MSAPEPEPPLFRQARAWVRPWPLTGVCLAGGLLVVGVWLIAARGGPARMFGRGFYPYLVATTGSLAVALLGLWWGKRWAFFALPLAFALDDAVVLAMGELRWQALVVQLSMVSIVLLNYPRRNAR